VETGRSVLQRLGFQGVVKIDFKRDVRTGRLYLMEINPRFNLWHYLGAVSGVNLPQVAHRDLHGSWAGPPPAYRTGRRWISLSLDARSTWSALRRRQLAPVRWLRTYLGPKVFNTFAWDDPRPSLVAVQRLAARTVRVVVPRSCRVGAPAVSD
jgi:predicted ATP-grasp superfamily ATP-dependent carboligase